MCLAVPLEVIEIAPSGRIGVGVVRMGQARCEVSLDLVDGVRVGEYVLVHAGVAIEKLDEEAALESLALFGQMAEIMRREDEREGPA